MVARGSKSRCESPCFNVHVELDNRALKAKNNGLIQSVTKLQQENAELSKQITFLQGESFELKSRYNNLKNVISIIDSTTKTCLPKLNEVVETFTGIIQLCSVAANISNSNRDTRTQAVKPQIVNGHVLHNPTITLSRLDNDDAPYTPPRASTSRISSNIVIRPSTSRGLNDVNRDRNSNLDRSQDEDSDNESQNENGLNVDMEEDTSFICQANRGVCKRKKSNTDMSRLRENDLEDSDEELPLAEEEMTEESQESDQRLTTIEEDEEEEADEEDEGEEEEISSPASPRARQRRFLKGRLQEVKIYLNQLPTTYIEQFMGSGNISISVSPPERRSSYNKRSSSLVGEANETFLEENISVLSTVRMEDFNLEENSSLNCGRSKLSLTIKGSSPAKSPTYFGNSCNSSNDTTLQFSKNLSPIRNLPANTPNTSSFNDSSEIPTVASPIRNLAAPTPNASNSNDSSEMPSLSLQGLELASSASQHRTSTPIVPRRSSQKLFNRTDSLNRSSTRDSSLTFKNNVTKRRGPREKRKVAQVILDRLSGEKRNSSILHDTIKDIANSPLITKRSQMKTRSGGKSPLNSSNSEEENVENNVETAKISATRKKVSKTARVTKIEKEPVTPTIKSPLKKSPVGRPKRAARPTTLKEPNLHKKMRRSK